MIRNQTSQSVRKLRSLPGYSETRQNLVKMTKYFNPILGHLVSVELTELGRDPWIIVRCKESGFVFLADPPEYSQLESELAWENAYEAEVARRQIEQPFALRLSFLTKKIKSILIPKQNKFAALTVSLSKRLSRIGRLRVLDIGSGEGHLMSEMYRRFKMIGLDVSITGIEVSKRSAEQAIINVSQFGGQVLETNALEGITRLDPCSFDVVAMSSFLEHERDPLTLLKRLRPILTTDGVIVLKVPNFSSWNRNLRGRKWCGFRFPDHVNYFTPTTLGILAENAGYKVVRQNIFDRFPFNDNMYAVLAISSGTVN